MGDTPLSDALRPNLALALRFLREQRKLSQKELALRAKIGRSQLSGYEKGKLNPSFESLLRIMAVLKADFHDLHNAVKVAAGKLDEVCASRRLEPETEEFLGRLGVALRDLYKPQAG
jgi:transcriptional regulator with XRE-family HTH domain